MATPDQDGATLSFNRPEYRVESFIILERHEAIRRRPAMYVGDTGEAGLHTLVRGLLVDVSGDGFGGYCTRVRISLHPDGSCSVKHDGPALPVVFDHASGTWELELGRPDVGDESRGGLAILTALSEWCTIASESRGVVHRSRYERGRPTGPLRSSREMGEEGTRISFKPDPEIFRDAVVSFTKVMSVVKKLVPRDGELMVLVEDKRDHRTYLHGRGTSLVL